MRKVAGFGPPAPGLLRIQGDALVVRIPAGGVDPSWLARPLEDLERAAGAALRAMRVESPPEWRWGTADAAFLTRVLQRIGAPHGGITVQGLPQDLHKLLALARTQLSAPAGTPAITETTSLPRASMTRSAATSSRVPIEWMVSPSISTSPA